MISLVGVHGVQGCAGLCFSTQHALSPRIPGAVGLCVGCAGLSCAQAYAPACFLKPACINEKKIPCEIRKSIHTLHTLHKEA